MIPTSIKVFIAVSLITLVLADPPKPKSLFRTGNALETWHDVATGVKSNYTSRFDELSQTYRVEQRDNKGVYRVSIYKYLEKTAYHIASTSKSTECILQAIPRSPTIFDDGSWIFQNATFTDVVSVNDNIVDAWTGTSFTRADIITYIDSFTGIIVQTLSKDTNFSVKYINFDKPDASYFAIPDHILVKCKKQVIDDFKLHPLVRLFQ
jgi:hypothetical protein